MYSALNDFKLVRRADQLGVYIHFPYCIHKCSYCDFYSLGLDRSGSAKSVSAEQIAQYLSSLTKEFEGRRRNFERYAAVNTIFFGGGTASLLPADSIYSILELIRRQFQIEGDAEITLEGNPENFSDSYIREIKDAGINRIHVGIQSLRHKTLSALDRYFDPDRYEEILSTLKNSVIENRGGDLMYGVPGQLEEEFYDDLNRLIGTGVSHLSLYSLTQEKGTSYDLAVKKKQANPPDDELQGRIFATLPSLMKSAHFTNYEVSNFGKGNSFSRHNLRYWLYESTFALGPGAHGFDGKNRYGNPRNTAHWLDSPLDAKLEEHEPELELPLCILRILLPIPLVLIRELCTECFTDSNAYDKMQGLFQKWSDRKLASLTDSFFQWQPSGIQYLNDRIVEMQETLSV